MMIAIDQIVVGDRRKPNPATIASLAKSIEEIGLLNPIQVRSEGNKQRRKGPYHLVAGLHRLEACKSLGMEMISASVILEDRAELAEIDENLEREELSTLERSQLLARKTAILAERHKELSTKNVGNRGRPVSSGREKAIQETAADTGQHPNQVRNIITRAAKIADDVQDAIASTPAADSGVELDALASLSHDEQRQAVEYVEKTGGTFRDAREFIRGESAEEEKTAKALTKLRTAWAGATDDAREKFLTEIDGWERI